MERETGQAVVVDFDTWYSEQLERYESGCRMMMAGALAGLSGCFGLSAVAVSGLGGSLEQAALVALTSLGAVRFLQGLHRSNSV